MISHTTDKFWKLYSDLSVDVQKQAKIAYIQFKTNPYHPSLQFKRVHSSKPIYSVRISIDYRQWVLLITLKSCGFGLVPIENMKKYFKNYSLTQRCWALR